MHMQQSQEAIEVALLFSDESAKLQYLLLTMHTNIVSSVHYYSLVPIY